MCVILTQSTLFCAHVCAHSNPCSSGPAVLQLKKTFGAEHSARNRKGLGSVQNYNIYDGETVY